MMGKHIKDSFCGRRMVKMATKIMIEGRCPACSDRSYECLSADSLPHKTVPCRKHGKKDDRHATAPKLPPAGHQRLIDPAYRQKYQQAGIKLLLPSSSLGYNYDYIFKLIGIRSDNQVSDAGGRRGIFL